MNKEELQATKDLFENFKNTIISISEVWNNGDTDTRKAIDTVDDDYPFDVNLDKCIEPVCKWANKVIKQIDFELNKPVREESGFNCVLNVVQYHNGSCDEIHVGCFHFDSVPETSEELRCYLIDNGFSRLDNIGDGQQWEAKFYRTYSDGYVDADVFDQIIVGITRDYFPEEKDDLIMLRYLPTHFLDATFNDLGENTSNVKDAGNVFREMTIRAGSKLRDTDTWPMNEMTVEFMKLILESK